MPVEMIGWIAPRVSSEIIPPSGPPFDAEVIAETVCGGVKHPLPIRRTGPTERRIA
jgi:hypothetical protein